MDFVQNFPAVSILLCLFAGIISSGLRKNAARFVNKALLLTEIVLNACVLLYTVRTGRPMFM